VNISAARYTAALALLAACMWGLEHWQPQAAVWAFLGLTAATGMLHGAADVWLMREPHLRFGRPFIQALAVYAALVVVLLAALAPYPGVALVLLLALSLVHFGQAAAQAQPLSKLWVFAIGGAPIAAPWWLDRAALEAVLTQTLGLVGTQWAIVQLSWAVIAWGAAAACAIAWLGAARAAFKNEPRTSATSWAELLMPWALNALLSPLAAFALYFGVHHSGGHLWRVWRWQRASLAALLGVWLVALAVWWALATASGHWSVATLWANTQVSSALQAAVVALAALTVPHGFVVSRWHRLLPAGC
jgi:beta-carotene 15,15'-dioxygenase